MAPVAIDTPSLATTNIEALKAARAQGTLLPPATTLERYRKAGIDLSNGYPYYPVDGSKRSLQEVSEIRSQLRGGRAFVDPATRADKEKKALFASAKEVNHLTAHIGTELVGIQLADLNDKQRDELALLVAERSVVFFRNQDISPQKQRELGVYLGDGEIEIHPQGAQVPGVGGGVTLIWYDGGNKRQAAEKSFRHIYPEGHFGWHSDLVHEHYPPTYTHLHQDAVPAFGGGWSTVSLLGYSAYDKLSPKFRSIIDGLNGIYRSADKYHDANDPHGEPKHVLRVHPLVRTNPATGWKALYVNRSMTVGIEGLDKLESDAILEHLYSVYERNLDIQVRWKWTPGSSAIWDNRTTNHSVSFDQTRDNTRHGTRVSSLGEKPYFDPKSKSRREALGLDD